MAGYAFGSNPPHGLSCFHFRASDLKSALRIALKVDDSMLGGCTCLSQRSMI
jgi:hypothetical protein